MRLRHAFTLIELLVVIAIIAILAAILFPVFSRAKEAGYRNGDIANMNAIRTALQLYRVDQGGYPPALLGYVTTYTPGGTDTIPADRLRGFLYPRRVESIQSFRPAFNRVGFLDTTTAVFPPQDLRAVGSAPILDLNGDGRIDNADDVAGARQAAGPNDGPVCRGWTVGCQAIDQLNFYKVSGYDVAEVPTPSGVRRVEIRYAPFWSDFAVNSNGNSQDDPRQLGYAEPPETTVVTWNSFFRDHVSGVPTNAKKDMILFLGGGARPYDSKLIYDRAWRTLP
jgi:prepilin-type N-terminal cleavage/methylation domain-containing protein